MALLTIDEAPDPVSRPGGWREHPLLRLGFRPFYLLAAVFAAFAIPLWLARFVGYAPALRHFDLNWHMHEMVFGFAIAVIVGFLYTAGRNWTGLRTPHGARLATLAALWIAGRAAMLLAPPLVAAIIDSLFLPLAAWPLYRVLRRAGNRRNLFLVGLLALLAVANLAFHAAALGWLPWSPLVAIQAAILLIVMIESVMGGRVIPGFTRNAVPGSSPVTHAGRDKITLGLTALAGLAWLIAPAPFAAACALAAACMQFLRLAGWQPQRTLGNPLLWILHLSYAWIPAGLVLLALAALGHVPASAAFHALAIGSMAGLVIGMITRTALGHTGRPLAARSAETAMYLLVQAGAVIRLAAALELFHGSGLGLMLAAACWSAAFLLYVAAYGPYLTRARVDGRPE